MFVSWENICYIVYLGINSKFLPIHRLCLTVRNQPLLSRDSKNWMMETQHPVSNSSNMHSSKYNNCFEQVKCQISQVNLPNIYWICKRLKTSYYANIRVIFFKLTRYLNLVIYCRQKELKRENIEFLCRLTQIQRAISSGLTLG